MEEKNQTLPLKNSASGGLTYSVATIFYFVVSVIASAIIGGLHLEAGSDAYLYITYLGAPLGIVATLLLISKIRHLPLREFAPIKCKPKYYLIAVMLAFGLLFSLNWLNEVTVEFFKLFGYVERESSSYLPTLSGGYVILAILIMAVIPAICEELLFRGAILNCMKEGAGGIATILLTGLVFSLFHGSPEQTAYQFVCGCLFAFLVLRAGSVLPTILAHFLNNAVIVILYAAGGVDSVTGDLLISNGAFIALIVISALCLIGGVVWLILDKNTLSKRKKGEIKDFFLYASVGIVLMLIVWIFSLLGVS